MLLKVLCVVVSVAIAGCRCSGVGFRRHSGTVEDDSIAEPLAEDLQRFAPILELSNKMTTMILGGQVQAVYDTYAADSLKRLVTAEGLQRMLSHVAVDVGPPQAFRAGQWNFAVTLGIKGSYTNSIKVVTHERGSMYYTFTFADEHAQKIIGLHFSQRKPKK